MANAYGTQTKSSIYRKSRQGNGGQYLDVTVLGFTEQGSLTIIALNGVLMESQVNLYSCLLYCLYSYKIYIVVKNTRSTQCEKSVYKNAASEDSLVSVLISIPLEYRRDSLYIVIHIFVERRVCLFIICYIVKHCPIDIRAFNNNSMVFFFDVHTKKKRSGSMQTLIPKELYEIIQNYFIIFFRTVPMIMCHNVSTIFF